MIEDTYIIYGATLALFLLFLFVFVEDMKTRTIRVSLLAGLLLTGLLYSAGRFPTFGELAQHSLWNAAFISVQVLILWLYISLRYRSGFTSLMSFIGLGDLLFWLVITPLLPFDQFFIHFTGSLFVALLLHKLLAHLAAYNKKQVPLAGMQSLYLAAVCTANVWIS